jgi:hypothetical protein
VCRRRHLSKRTEESYRFWIRQFIFHFIKRHPRELREGDVAQFLNHLAVRQAGIRAGIMKHATVQTLRQFATQLLASGTDIRTIQLAWAPQSSNHDAIYACFGGYEKSLQSA